MKEKESELELKNHHVGWEPYSWRKQECFMQNELLMVLAVWMKGLLIYYCGYVFYDAARRVRWTTLLLLWRPSSSDVLMLRIFENVSTPHVYRHCIYVMDIYFIILAWFLFVHSQCAPLPIFSDMFSCYLPWPSSLWHISPFPSFSPTPIFPFPISSLPVHYPFHHVSTLPFPTSLT